MSTALATATATQQRLFDRARDAYRLRHDRLRTEDAYADWIKRFIHD